MVAGADALAPLFIRIAFGQEHGAGAAVLNRWDGQLRYRIVGPADAGQRVILEAQMAELGALTGLDAVAGEPAAFVIQTGTRPDDAELRATFPGLGSGTLSALRRARCFFVFRADSGGSIRKALAFVPAALEEPAFRHCAAEETAQALGLPNDAGPPDSIFDDDNTAEALTPFDRLMLRTLYAGELRPGMPREEAGAAAWEAIARLLKE